MPNRVIKESIKRSAQIDSLTWFEEVVYYRLIVTADDYGCVDGRAILLKNELFPLKENVTKKSVEEAISRLVKAGLLYSYEVSGIPYLLFPTWERHQRIRSKHRKYPAPECLTANCSHMSANCGHMSATCQPESESESEIESESESGSPPLKSPPTYAVGHGVEAPRLEEVEKFCQDNGLSISGAEFHRHYTAAGWIDGKGEPIRNWRAYLLRLADNAKKEPQKGNGITTGSSFETGAFMAAAMKRAYE